jgi:hypothetical protein
MVEKGRRVLRRGDNHMLTCVPTGDHTDGRVRWLITASESIKFPAESKVQPQVKFCWPSGEYVKSDHRCVVILLPGIVTSGERASSLRNFETWVMGHQ